MASGASPASASTASRRETGAMPSHESPTFTSTVSGTDSGSAPSIASRRTGIRRSTSSRGASSSSSSWTESRTRARNAALAQRPVGPDHRDLDDVGGGALDRHVDRHPLAGGAQRRVARLELRDLALAAEQRGHVPSSRAVSRMWCM